MRKFLFGIAVILTLGAAANFTYADVTWEPDVRLTNNSADSAVSRDRSVAVDFQNRVHVVWTDNRDGNNEIYYKRGQQDIMWKVFGPVHQ